MIFNASKIALPCLAYPPTSQQSNQTSNDNILNQETLQEIGRLYTHPPTNLSSPNHLYRLSLECDTSNHSNMAVQSQQGLGGARHAVQAVNNMAELLRQMLERASSVKDSTDIEPALSGDDLADLLQNIESTSNLDKEDPRKSRQFSIIEIAVRDKFDELLVSHRSCNSRFTKSNSSI